VTQIGEGVSVPGQDSSGTEKKEPCRRIFLHAFRRDMTAAFLDDFQRKLQQSEDGTGTGPTFTECLMWSGHVGISFEGQSPIWGFNPDPGNEPIHVVLDKLKGRKSYPGHVTDDTSVFDEARRRGLSVLRVEYVYPESEYNEIRAAFDSERSSCSWNYSFPGGGGDCNCATFPARIGVRVPEQTGSMKLYIGAMNSAPDTQRMGDCDG
jgi:hypothetical protein